MRSVLVVLFSFFVLTGVLLNAPMARADSVSDIQSQIDDINNQRAALDKEIAGYQKQLNALGSQHQTLQTSISALDVSRSQTQAQISSIQKKIAAANLKLDQLSLQMTDQEKIIALDKAAVAESLRTLADSDDASLIESLLSADNLADAWRASDNLTSLNDALNAHAADLAAANKVLANQQSQVVSTKTDLTKSNTELGSQKQALDVQKAQKASLLAQTQQSESTYQSLIAAKKAQQKAFEDELANLQAQLTPVSSGSVPASGSGVLHWPFSDTFMQNCAGKSGALGNVYCVTQYFGNTAFATANAQIYNGMGHDGIDIGAPIGTPVQAALSGTVLGTGNTDIKAPDGRMCYSFGKWVMVTHPNGLATLYAHLSSINVTKGQSVSTGDVVGYSGMTGYATGPHLHFGVYAAAGVQIMDLGKWRGSAGTPCTSAGAVLPVAPTNAYLNPMSYL
jgi:murein DD-endopeptidase MepM/ murein hydrolase activator NlpD